MWLVDDDNDALLTVVWLGTWVLWGSSSSGGHAGSGNSQTVAADQDQDAADTSQVPLRLQPARPQSHLAGAVMLLIWFDYAVVTTTIRLRFDGRSTAFW